MADGSLQPFTVRADVMVPMRDGVRLATDVYLPEEAPFPLPVILERTPYDKTGVSRSEVALQRPAAAKRPEVAAYFAQRGYAVVMQDCRGRYRSEGEFTKYLREAEDGYDTLAWIVKQTWCDGRVGTMGVSYGAHAQLALACLAPPGLACMFTDSGGFASAYHGGIRRGGAFELKQVTWAYRHALLSPATAADPARREALRAVDLEAWFRDMPWRPGRSPLSAAPEYEAYLFEQWQSGLFTGYWKQPGLYAEGYYDDIPDIPVAIVGSWYDPYVSTCIGNFTGLSARHRAATRLVMGPWTHGGRSSTHAGAVDFGADSTLDGNLAEDYLAMRLAWFDRWLGPRPPPAVDDPPVRYFQMGGGDGGRDPAGRLRHGGRWRTAVSWPPPGVRWDTLFLDRAGALVEDRPTVEGACREYRHDPRDPVPTIGGALTSGEPLMEAGAFDQRVGPGVFTCRIGSAHEPLANRGDVLVFQTPPLTHDVVVTGEIEVELWVSSDCPDTDFTAKLVDVYPPSRDWPEGFAMNVTDGILRARYRDGWERESPMEPGRVYRVVVRPFATSNLFRAGHRIRLDVASSNYPQFDVNPNTGGPQGGDDAPRVATNRVHCCAAHASCLRLPVVED